MPLPVVGTPEWWLDRLGRRLTERAGRATFNRVGRRDDVGTERRLVDATGMALYQAYSASSRAGSPPTDTRRTA